MNYHPDDQDEIDRLHAEFIAVDEPYNEQVMAFQDASYVLGLKRGQGELAWEYSRAEDWCRAANKYSDSMCALGELLGVPEDDQSTGAVLDAVRGLKAREAALQQRLNEADQRIDACEEALAAALKFTNDILDPAKVRSLIYAASSQLTKDSPEVGL